MVFIDGNHTYEATMIYYKLFAGSMCIVFDDIAWSTDMIRAWRKIKLIRAGSAIDLFKMGIVFPGQEKKNYQLWF